MIQKIQTAKLPGNCLYSALKLPRKYFEKFGLTY